jgi:uncharacterized protein (TIGR02466 family)
MERKNEIQSWGGSKIFENGYYNVLPNLRKKEHCSSIRMKNLIFTSSFWYASPDVAFNSELEALALKTEKEHASLKISNQTGYQSPGLNINPLLTRFFNAIKPSVLAYIEALQIKGPYQYTTDDPWININRKGDANIPHNHPGSFLAAVYYIKTSPSCGDFCFYDTRAPNLLSLQYQQRTHENSSIWRIKPKAGTLMIFPADLLHAVDPNQSDESRISLSFNLNITQHEME